MMSRWNGSRIGDIESSSAERLCVADAIGDAEAAISEAEDAAAAEEAAVDGGGDVDLFRCCFVALLVFAFAFDFGCSTTYSSSSSSISIVSGRVAAAAAVGFALIVVNADADAVCLGRLYVLIVT